jgi:hypothetical protein
MDGRSIFAGAAAALAISAVGGAASASTVTVNLGPSSENFTLYGLGDVPTLACLFFGTCNGSYSIGQGGSTFDGTTSTFTLSGDVLATGTPGYNTGTYKFVTTFAGPDTPLAGPNAPQGVTSTFEGDPGDNQFVYSFLDPSTTMTLYLLNASNVVYRTIPIATAGLFDGPGFGFSYTAAAACTGLGANPCLQSVVGETPGSTIYGPVTIGVSFDAVTSVPEPATWAMMLVGFAGLGAALRSVRRNPAAIA